MKAAWLVAWSVWAGAQVWYWMALRTVKVAGQRMANLQEAERRAWREWLREDRPYKECWRPLLAATVVFPAHLVALVVFCGFQLLLVTALAPLRRRSLTPLHSAWLHDKVRSVLRTLAWLELKCLGVRRVEEFEVLNRDLMDERAARSSVAVREVARGWREDDAPRNYVANHVSYTDIVLFIALLFPSFCSKAGVARVPLIGDTAKWLDCIFINRGSTRERRSVLSQIQERQLRIWQAGACSRNLSNERLANLLDFRQASGKEAPPGYERTSPLLVFPEGTTSNGRYLLPFKKGAFAALMPVAPVILVYDCPFFNVSYEILPIVWLFPVLAGCPTGAGIRIYWLPELCPTVDMIATRGIAQYTAAVRRAMGRVLLTVRGADPVEEDWTGDLESKRACISRLFG